MPMTCCRKPGCGFTRCATRIATASRRYRGSTRLPGTFASTTIENPIRAAAGEKELEEMSKGVSTTPHQAGELEALLAPLSESQREVIAMLKVEGMSLEEVARATSSSVGSVKQKVHRAYKKLRETIGATTPRKWRSGGLA